MSRTKKLLCLVAVITATLGPVHSALADPSQHPHVPMQRTPMSRVELLQALRDGHVKAFGILPSRERLAMAWGQVAFENGHGKFVFNHNLGNVGTTAKGQPSYFNRGDGQWYRHHATFVDGAAAYWEIIARCAAAIHQFDAGNAVAAAANLKRCGYFEADLSEYTRGFASLYRFALKDVFGEEEHERRQQQELSDACSDELANLVEAASVAQLETSSH